jgi:hypothetical protein
MNIFFVLLIQVVKNLLPLNAKYLLGSYAMTQHQKIEKIKLITSAKCQSWLKEKKKRKN